VLVRCSWAVDFVLPHLTLRDMRSRFSSPLQILLTLVSILSLAAQQSDAAEKRPNVLFIIADDLTKTLPCYGYSLAKAPNVDRLAARAVRFDRAYAQYPVCSPSRVSFFSGRRPEHTGMYANGGDSRTPLLKDAVFMPQHFKANGYFTARLGKVFHIGSDVPECWDVTEEGSPGTKIVYQPQEVDKLGLASFVTASHKLKGGGGEGASYSILKGGKDQLIDVRNGKRAVELLEQGAKQNAEGKPFFLAVGFRRPHLPHVAPFDFFDLYPAEKMPLPEQGGPKIKGIKSDVSAEDSREALRGYLACVSFMDEQLGRVLDAMDAQKLWDNTIVVLLGDHGYLLGSRGGWWGKGVLYNEAASTTLLVAAPGKAKGVGCSRIVEFLDFYPTLAELCDLPAPVGVEGKSFVPLLTKPDAPWDQVAYTMVAKDSRPAGLAVSNEQFRYLENADGTVELFDIQADPREWHNLADKPEHAATLTKMQKLAAEHRQKFWK
jgi:iduronate 2-sulfatase